MAYINFQITQKGKEKNGKQRTILVMGDSSKSTYTVLSGSIEMKEQLNGLKFPTIVDDNGTGRGQTFNDESSALKYFKSELKKHDSVGWEYIKKSAQDNAFTSAFSESLSLTSRGVGSTSTSNT